MMEEYEIAAKQPFAVVVGAVNIDVGGQTAAPLIAKDSNPGTVRVSLGGVGRNIAHNLSLLGIKTRFFTAFGDDAYADKIEASCGMLGISIRYAKKVRGRATSTYLFINDEKGEMQLAINDMAICEEITPAYLKEQMDAINEADVVVADANIPAESLAYLCEHCEKPVFVDPVSVTKAKKVLPLLGKIHTIKPNAAEAALLTGIAVKDATSQRAAAKELVLRGTKRAFLSMGEDGVLLADETGVRPFACCPAKTVNTTGAGDAFMAGLVWAYLKNCDPEMTVRAAAACAAIAVEGEEAINESLSEQKMLKRMEASQASDWR